MEEELKLRIRELEQFEDKYYIILRRSNELLEENIDLRQANLELLDENLKLKNRVKDLLPTESSNKEQILSTNQTAV
ncbi:unnamed protein product, partial [Brachionus calyciflorus]